MPNCAILLAGGSGRRMRGAVKDKVLEPLFGMPVILHSFKAFADSGKIGEVVFVCRDELQQRKISAALKKFFPKCQLSVKFTNGGAERQDSVLNGLDAASDKSALAFIHDGARPLITPQNVGKLAETAEKDGAAVLARRVSDTIKRIPKGKKNLSKCRLADLDRKRLWAMETPQVFICSEIRNAYRFVRKNKLAVTDDVAAAAACGIRVSITENLSPNVKITVPEDIAFIEFLKTRQPK